MASPIKSKRPFLLGFDNNVNCFLDLATPFKEMSMIHRGFVQVVGQVMRNRVSREKINRPPGRRNKVCMTKLEATEPGALSN